MTEPPDPARPSTVSRLLLKAVKQLPEEEQRIVFEYFFERGVGFPQAPLLGRFIHDAVQLRGSAGQMGGSEATSLSTMFAVQKPIGPDQIMIPVRLSEAQHRRLKQWSAEHNFPMAVVVRGLIERFLDGWEKRSA